MLAARLAVLACHDWCDRSHLHCRAATHPVGSDHGSQIARRDRGFVRKCVTVSEVAVAAVTVPTAPSLKSIVLLPGVVLKPKPLMVIVVALAARLEVLLVTTGAVTAGHLNRGAAAYTHPS